MTGGFSVNTSGTEDALNRYAEHRRMLGDIKENAVRRVMRYWIDFTVNKMSQRDANGTAIWSEMGRIESAYTKIQGSALGVSTNLRSKKVKRDKVVDRWKGSVAARLVAVLNYKNARNLPASQFYRLASKFAQARRFSAGFHKSGWRNAKLRLRGKLDNVKNFKNSPGSYKERVKQSMVEIMAENYARAGGQKADGVDKLFPDVLEQTWKEIEAMLLKFIQQDMDKHAEESGLTVNK
jgi:hypothetical protein